MTKLTDHAEIRKFIIGTIRTGDKIRIQKVLKRYYEWLKEQDKKDTTYPTIYQTALEIFK